MLFGEELLRRNMGVNGKNGVQKLSLVHMVLVFGNASRETSWLSPVFFFLIGNKKNFIKKKTSQPEYSGDVLWGQKSRTKMDCCSSLFDVEYLEGKK